MKMRYKKQTVICPHKTSTKDVWLRVTLRNAFKKTACNLPTGFISMNAHKHQYQSAPLREVGAYHNKDQHL